MYDEFGLVFIFTHVASSTISSNGIHCKMRREWTPVSAPIETGFINALIQKSVLAKKWSVTVELDSGEHIAAWLRICTLVNWNIIGYIIVLS